MIFITASTAIGASKSELELTTLEESAVTTHFISEAVSAKSTGLDNVFKISIDLFNATWKLSDISVG